MKKGGEKMPVKTLVLVFQNQSGDSIRMSVPNVKDDIADAEVKTAMEDILTKNIFDSTGGNLTIVMGAQIVTRSVQELSVK
jgi:hypothetical protein